MADIKAIAEELVNLTVKEVQEVPPLVARLLLQRRRPLSMLF